SGWSSWSSGTSCASSVPGQPAGRRRRRGRLAQSCAKVAWLDFPRIRPSGPRDQNRFFLTAEARTTIDRLESCGLVVLLNQAANPIPSPDPGGQDSRWCALTRQRHLIRRPVVPPDEATETVVQHHLGLVGDDSINRPGRLTGASFGGRLAW